MVVLCSGSVRFAAFVRSERQLTGFEQLMGDSLLNHVCLSRDSERLRAERRQSERLVGRVAPSRCDGATFDQGLVDEPTQSVVPALLAVADVSKCTELRATEHALAERSSLAERFLAEHRGAQAGFAVSASSIRRRPRDGLQHHELGVDEQFRDRRRGGPAATTTAAAAASQTSHATMSRARAVGDVVAKVLADQRHAGSRIHWWRSRSWPGGDAAASVSSARIPWQARRRVLSV